MPSQVLGQHRLQQRLRNLERSMHQAGETQVSKTRLIRDKENPKCFPNLFQVKQYVFGRKGQEEINGDQSHVVELFPICQPLGRYPRAIE